MGDSFLFVRPPRPLWPFTGPTNSFWPPLAFASMAAALRESIPDLEVRILDAPVLKMGWKTLARRLESDRPTYVGIGEEAVCAKEGLRLASLARALGARVIAGGCFFGHVAEEALGTGLIDAVVRGEGEETLVELVRAWEDPSSVDGVSYGRDGEVRHNPPREPMAELDRLPMPAYDLLPVERYGRGSRNHPDFAALELSRGCIGACTFCVLWRQMGRQSEGRTLPHLRVKSPERARDEVRWMTARFGRRYIRWVDPCFNAHPAVPGDMAELLLRDGSRIDQSAWVRTDCIVRDHASGALRSQVRAGLNEVFLGVERPDPKGLRQFARRSDGGMVADEALSILAREHPQVFTVGSFIYGLPGDDRELMRGMHRFALALDLDKAFYIPLTPLPGTPYWDREQWDDSGERFRDFDFLPSCKRNGTTSKLARHLAASFAVDWPKARIRAYWRRLRSPDPRRRRMTRRLLGRAAHLTAGLLVQTALGRGRFGAMRIPRWYES